MNSAETAELFCTAQEFCRNNKAATAVVVNTWRTAPRPIGGRLIVRDDAVFAGSVSGGCVEKEVIIAAQECMQKQCCQMLSFGIADETAWQSGLSCGGEMSIFVAPFPSAQMDAQSQQSVVDFLRAVDSRQSGVLITDLQNGGLRFLHTATRPPNEGLMQTLSPAWQISFNTNNIGDSATPESATPESTPPLEKANPHPDSAVEHPSYFVEWCAPPWQLFIIGATHIAQALAPMATACGFAVTIIDPRSGFANPQRFANTRLLAQWPDDSFITMPMDDYTAVVTLSHDPKIDDPALVAALRANAPYIGALGSTRTRDRRNQRLRENGFADSDIARIHAPVGLHIGAQTAAEIAVSIIAEIIAACTPTHAAS